ncbi:phosphate signaling complex protein PhoU [Verrucomicrobia bacterium]|nr:phosphate signaling complex protein PhoU [Verrucomicrobiota bacterium]
MHQIEIEIKSLTETILKMASVSAQTVELAIEGIIERDDDKLRCAIKQDSEIDSLEMEIDQRAFNLFAKAPLAGDLRLIMIATKASSDLERIGDEATTIARRGLELSKEPKLKEYVDIPRMTQIGMKMLRDAFASFVNGDSDAARAIVKTDKDVDMINKQMHRELAGYMVEAPRNITRCLHLMTISKALERIADHAKNIAEEVVFLHEGQDIRHGGNTLRSTEEHPPSR